MQVTLLRSGGDDNNESDKPCFIFWTQTDYLSPGFASNPTTPYVYRHPEGVIDDYKTPKYNTRYVYPPYSEWVHAVGIAPGSLVPENNTAGWKEFNVPEASAGLVDIQCAPVVKGSQQLPFSDPLLFAHQLTKLEIHGYCGSSMKEGDSKYINVKDIKITISSDYNDQWKWFPKKLVWNGDDIDGQYIVNPYSTQPSEIIAEISTAETLFGKTDTSKDEAKTIGSFYLVPGFNTITITVEATYVDSTIDENYPGGNGQEITRVWDVFTINDLHPLSGSFVTSKGESYIFKISFDRSRIELSAELEDWGDEIHN